MSCACESKAKNEPATTDSMMSAMASAAALGGGPKFGAEGANVGRIMALSEKSRPVHTKTQQVRKWGSSLLW